MSRTHPDPDTLRSALALATRAPSVHNTQPWQWRLGDTTVHLYSDDSRRLPQTDPDGRELVLSCGAALHHLEVAMRALGWAAVVHRLPNPAEPRHLAALEFRHSTPDAEAERQARAITRRRSDRRRFTSWEMQAPQSAAVAAAGDLPGVAVRVIDSALDRARLLRTFRQAADLHAHDPSYTAELRAWSGRHAAPQGVPARNAVATPHPTVRPFADPRLPEAVVRDTDEAAQLLLLSTASDDRLSWLRAGESASAILLAATTHGLATCPLSEPFEIPALRERVRTEVLNGFGHPQLIIRMGWAATSAAAVPATPRLPLGEVVRPLATADRPGAAP
ncbi:Acg family FMN-binding oxidoreductase [Nocardia huaxiensis]|uniref:Acg family FMN-binding oxidoreductase n=1 Tax=Nocardia huaxiensis TaxID=2755382 RepID=UPI001E626CB6|nr:NAD(P)H nitroreductase [Nocardia huaxiensis]UFS99897.1 NAD(P)H nitroreductase [Nocardia huaxiensis]